MLQLAHKAKWSEISDRKWFHWNCNTLCKLLLCYFEDSFFLFQTKIQKFAASDVGKKFSYPDSNVSLLRS